MLTTRPHPFFFMPGSARRIVWNAVITSYSIHYTKLYEVVYQGADMSRPEAIAQMMRAATERFGALDVVVNNAGIQHVAPIEEFP